MLTQKDSKRDSVAPSPLEGKLKALINAQGALSVAEYMRLCLLDPEHGYYTTGRPFGAKGDFVTAPDISQMFGEILGAWCIHQWQQLGCPKSFTLMELVPGRGTLMADILRVAKGVPEFLEAADIQLIEASPSLIAAQKDALKEYQIEWRDTPLPLKPQSLILVANEFLDALPIHQHVFTDRGWRERLIGWENGKLQWQLSSEAAQNLKLPDNANKNDVFETCPDADSIVSNLTQHLKSHQGALLLIDYGHDGSTYSDTFQAIKSHSYSDPLCSPGEVDLTAHVNFKPLAPKDLPYTFSTQGHFLRSLGIDLRLASLLKGATKKQAQDLHSQHHRLTHGSEMGELFKVLEITSLKLSAP